MIFNFIAIILLVAMSAIIIYTIRWYHKSELERLSNKVKYEKGFKQFLFDVFDALSDDGCYCDAPENVETPEDVTVREVLDILELQNQRIMNLEDKYEKLSKKYKKLKNKKKSK